MSNELLHVFRNAPYGRETLLFSAYTCRRLKLKLRVYLPRDPRFLIYFAHQTVQVDLDASYLRKPETARATVEHLLSLGPELSYSYTEPTGYTGTGLPDLAGDVSIMACPRSMSETISHLGLGLLGPKVRNLIVRAPFPILIPPGAYKPWTRLAVLYGGSDLAGQALQFGLRMAQSCNLPLQVVSFGSRDTLLKAAAEQGVAEKLDQVDWILLDGRPNPADLDVIPHDAMVLLGACGHGPIRSMFGGTMEMVQSELPNPLLVFGPQYRPCPDFA